jgi:hypothetical protein
MGRLAPGHFFSREAHENSAFNAEDAVRWSAQSTQLVHTHIKEVTRAVMNVEVLWAGAPQISREHGAVCREALPQL